MIHFILGDTPVIYFILNKSLRKAVKEMFLQTKKFQNPLCYPKAEATVRIFKVCLSKTLIFSLLFFQKYLKNIDINILSN